MAYHLGNGGVPSNIMDMVNQGNYSGAADAIQALGVGTPYVDRRNAEANLLRQLPNTNQTDSTQ